MLSYQCGHGEGRAGNGGCIRITWRRIKKSPTSFARRRPWLWADLVGVADSRKQDISSLRSRGVVGSDGRCGLRRTCTGQGKQACFFRSGQTVATQFKSISKPKGACSLTPWSTDKGADALLDASRQCGRVAVLMSIVSTQIIRTWRCHASTKMSLLTCSKGSSRKKKHAEGRQ